ncbi:fungal chitosanase of glycosyl hydrolase group 75-domain-containing protein [Rhypophila decipiens]|uniref:Endo-chitosanase n=1 Tax=Rhypophila decipiens TaxID=261697 RepID=A0AAN6YA27_9PEZI|nr:fungal chitosanase of glycosyl hydrolase group 75-domain-containing protein [Rhypophila decipiens]
MHHRTLLTGQTIRFNPLAIAVSLVCLWADIVVGSFGADATSNLTPDTRLDTGISSRSGLTINTTLGGALGIGIRALSSASSNLSSNDSSSGGGGAGRPLPENLSKFYDDIRAKGSCSRVLATGFWATDTGDNSFSYCGDHLDDYNILYIQGKHGALADMDIDCDGVVLTPNGSMPDAAKTGRCSYDSSPDLQNMTAFRDTIQQYDVGIADLNTYIHPYVVLGNEAAYQQKRLWTGRVGTVRANKDRNWKTFDPTGYGVLPLSLVAVVCGGGGNEQGGRKLVYGIWGDTNGDDDEHPMVGETSLSLATACYGDNMSGDNGHDETDVLYLAFLGSDAVPGPTGADWKADSFEQFERSIETLGDRLVERVGASVAARGFRVGRGGSGSGGMGQLVLVIVMGWGLFCFALVL